MMDENSKKRIKDSRARKLTDDKYNKVAQY
jgi:hypothetical protein